MKAKHPLVFCIGANHTSAAIEFREELYLKRDDISLAVPQILQKHGLKEVMVLSTCNRLELYGIVETGHEITGNLFEAYVDLQRLSPSARILKREQIAASTYQYFSSEAVKHIFKVASGLDSLVLGETQITGQFKEATSHAREMETLGPILGRLTQEALTVVKKVRTQTDIGRKTVSIGHAAIDLAGRLYGNISDHRVMIIGAGEMASIAAKYAVKYKPKGLVIVNRTLARAEALVAELGMGEAHSLDKLVDHLATHDIIISSTASEDFVLTRKLVEQAQTMRRNRSLFLIDIALPRDIDPACGQVDDVYLFDIDDLKQVVGENIEERRLAAEKAEVLIDDNTGTFMRWIDSLAVKPALSGFRNYLDDLFLRESERTLGREAFHALTEEQRAGIAGMLESIASKISRDASMRVRTPPTGYFQEDLANALKVLFPVPEANKESEEE